MGRNSQNSRPLRPAVFLDRDGTINVEKEYLYRIEDFEFIPGAPEAIKRLKNAGYLVIVVTNQSGVARGYYSLDDVDKLHQHIQTELAKYGTAVDAFYSCPHHPTEGVNEFVKNCDCRKPEPGMLLRAAKDFGADLKRSIMVGDKFADIKAGESVGCNCFIVLTGYGMSEKNMLEGHDITSCSNLLEAANVICG